MRRGNNWAGARGPYRFTKHDEAWTRRIRGDPQPEEPRRYGEALRLWRLREHLTQAAAAKRLGVGRSLLAQWEAGLRPVPDYARLALGRMIPESLQWPAA